MGDFLKDVEKELKATDLRFCGFDDVLSKLSAQLRKDVVEALAKHPTSAVGRVLRQRGHKVSDETIRRHLRGDCSCQLKEQAS